MLEEEVNAYTRRCSETMPGQGGIVDILVQSTLGWLALNDQDMGVSYANLIWEIGGEDRWREVAVLSKMEARRFDTGDFFRSDPRSDSAHKETDRLTCAKGNGPSRVSDKTIWGGGGSLIKEDG